MMNLIIAVALLVSVVTRPQTSLALVVAVGSLLALLPLPFSWRYLIVFFGLWSTTIIIYRRWLKEIGFVAVSVLALIGSGMYVWSGALIDQLTLLGEAAISWQQCFSEWFIRLVFVWGFLLVIAWLYRHTVGRIRTSYLKSHAPLTTYGTFSSRS